MAVRLWWRRRGYDHQFLVIDQLVEFIKQLFRCIKQLFRLIKQLVKLIEQFRFANQFVGKMEFCAGH